MAIILLAAFEQETAAKLHLFTKMFCVSVLMRLLTRGNILYSGASNRGFYLVGLTIGGLQIIRIFTVFLAKF